MLKDKGDIYYFKNYNGRFIINVNFKKRSICDFCIKNLGIILELQVSDYLFCKRGFVCYYVKI